jgi:hypothetical protein
MAGAPTPVVLIGGDGEGMKGVLGLGRKEEALEEVEAG